MFDLDLGPEPVIVEINFDHPQAVSAKGTYLDYRSVPTLAEAEKFSWYKDWFDGGINHREEKGLIVCERHIQHDIKIIDLAVLMSTMTFDDIYKLRLSSYKEYPFGIYYYED